ncbi:MAG: hypothetical protein H5T69_05470 [Chloroflexi bacterium]|nr:hypothetical protein [Chloroflexota bacterium]
MQSHQPQEERPPTDLRRYRAQTEKRLLVGGMLIMFLIGGGLLLWLFDLRALLGAWLCLAGGVGLIALLLGILKLMEWWSASGREDE